MKKNKLTVYLVIVIILFAGVLYFSLRNDYEFPNLIIQKYIDNGFVEIINIRNIKQNQQHSYQDCYDKHNNEYDWFLFCDCDEYLTLQQHNNINDYLSDNRFNEYQCKFILACMMVALEYIHSQNVIHRDIKPENLVFDDNGLIHITDFGVAKVYHKNNCSETSGTPGYMAPEVMCGLSHSYSVDYYGLGVIAYEIMIGKVNHF